MNADRIDFAAELNREQYRAVTAADGAALVLAGPGSGKTRTLVYRLAWLVSRGVPPTGIILLTFTNKAAREMMNRTEALLGRFPEGLTGGTFHHAGNLALRRYADRLGYTPGFTIADRADSRELLARCVKEITGGDNLFPKPELVAGIISFAVNSHRPLAEIVEERFPWLGRFSGDIERVAADYARRKKESNVADFDDLLSGWHQLLKNCGEARAYYQDKFRYILADEFQDTNRLQFEIIRLLAAGHGNIMAVGDDAQSIYSFRAADIANALEFPRVFPGTAIFRLETNYRSVPEILRLANESISRNRNQFPKKLRHVNPPGRKPVFFSAPNDRFEARFVVEKLSALAGAGITPDRVAVLFRNRFQSARLETELLARHVPYIIRGGLRFYEQAHVKDVLAFLKILACETDEISWRRIVFMRKGFGAGYFGRLWERIGAAPSPLDAFLAPGTPGLLPPRLRPEAQSLQSLLGGLQREQAAGGPGAAVNFLLEEYYCDYCRSAWPDSDARLEEISELAAIASGACSLEAFLSEATLGESFKGEGPAGSAPGPLTLSTIHQAKGLEWDAVFIIGLTDGCFPHGKSLENPEQLEEERRLFYVAATRAKQVLFLTETLFREGWSGGGGPCSFIRELPADCYEEVEAELEELPCRPARGPGRFRR